MKAWQVPELGEAEQVMTLRDVAAPEPGPGQLRARQRRKDHS